MPQSTRNLVLSQGPFYTNGSQYITNIPYIVELIDQGGLTGYYLSSAAPGTGHTVTSPSFSPYVKPVPELRLAGAWSGNGGLTATANVPFLQNIYTATVTKPDDAGVFDASFSLSNRGNLPSGATLTTTKVNNDTFYCTLAGTFTTAGDYSFEITAARQECTSVVRAVTLIVGTWRVYQVSMPQITTNVQYIQATVTPDSGTATYSLLDRGNLPAGATLNTTTSVLTAIFTEEKPYLFTVRAKLDGYNVFADVPIHLSTTQSTSPDFLVRSEETFRATVNVAVSQSLGIATQGGPTNVGTWAIFHNGTLPAGFALSTAGLLTGTFTAIGRYPFVIQVTSPSNEVIKKNIFFEVGVAATPVPPPIPPNPPVPPATLATVDSNVVDEFFVTRKATDDGTGYINPVQNSTGTVDYTSGLITFPPEMLFQQKKWSSARAANGTGTWKETAETDTFANGSTVTAIYKPYSVTPETATETAPAQSIRFSLTPYTSDSIVPNTVRFTIGSTVYEDNEGVIQHTVNGTTGVGTVAGTINYGTGEVNLTNWVAGSSTFTLQSLALFKGNFTETEMYFNIPSAPLRNSSFTLSVTDLDGTLLSATADSNQDLIGTGILGTIDSEYGLCSVRFGASVLDSSLTTEEKAEEWYDAGDVVGGYIWQPRKVILATARYNTVAYTSIPLSADVLGIDPVRLPSNGKVPALLKGQLVFVHHTTGQYIGTTLSSDQVFNCGRTRLYRATISGANGVRLSPEYYTVNRELGTVTMKPSAIVTTGLTTPFWLEHTIADLCVISDNDLSGWLTMTRPLSHTFPMTESKVSGVLYIGTLQARVTALFEQSTWTSVWQDTVIGSVPLAQYNDAQYPLVVTNQGAYPDRYLIKFTSSTAFQVIGENLGLIGVGDTSTNCAPLNALTGIPYFTIDYHGWGSGWATGNCLRFNLISASYPVDLARSIQPSAPSGLDVDSVELLLIGNIDQ